MQKKIVFIGSPGSGKTTIINKLIENGFFCMPEISREVTLKAQEDGIEQLFLEKPILFSEKLLEGRELQFLQADKRDADIVFFDRGIPSISAYLDYYNIEYPNIFTKKNKTYQYTKVFQFLPWEQIYTSDNERYETFKQACEISSLLATTYEDLGYEIITVPFTSVEERYQFIIDNL